MESTHYWAGYRDGKAQREANTGASDEAMWALHEANLDLAETLTRIKSYLADEYEDMCQTQQDQDRINAELRRRVEDLLKREADLLSRETDLTTKETDLTARETDLTAKESAVTRQAEEQSEAITNWRRIAPHLDEDFFRTWDFFADRGLNPKLSIYSQVSNYPTAA
jgi:chromosome segregation ATPase